MINEENGIPPVKRAREFKLYTYDGRILSDLYRGNGRAFSGHKPGRTVFTLKNLAEHGVFCAYPSVYGGRLQKALRSLFPEFPHAAVFASEAAALRVLPQMPADPARGESGSAVLWRPGLPVPAEAQLLLVRVPAGGFSGAAAVCGRRPLPDGDILSPVEAGVLTRAVYDWIALAADGLPAAPDIETTDFVRRGYYLEYKGTDYAARRLKALEAGVLLPPLAADPAILPLTATKGEWGKIKKALE